METEIKYCIMDDTDVEYKPSVELSDIQKVEQDNIDKMIMEKYSYLFSD